ncbi:MAG: ATP-binding cassette domain-containing protein, partial [Acidimicrobiia bacterium]|nr:ATP-binding cassette domain-containing protein [Acidimicrobiia bacterium]
MKLLEVRDLEVTYAGDVEALRGVDLTLDRGETVGVVGETGAGKSTLARCLIGLVQPPEARGSV